MILNIFTAISLFISSVTGVLALVLALFSFRIFQRSGLNLTGEERTAVENRSYLLLYMAVVILWVKLLSWPLFYFMLQSCIPYIQGAMCIFGVTRAQPYLGGAAQVIKPVVFFLIGAWLLLNMLDRGTEKAPLFRRKFLFLSVLSIVVLADSVHDFIYLTSMEVTSDVSCCTTFFDLPERTTASISVSLIGQDFEKYILPFYYSSNAVLIAFLAAAHMRFPLLRTSGPSIVLLLMSGSLLALVNALITIVALFEVIAPVVMQLPHHRCIYCMWQYVPGTILMTALFIAGTFFVNWALLLYLIGRHEETLVRLLAWLKNLYLFAIACLGTSLVMATIYLIIKGNLTR